MLFEKISGNCTTRVGCSVWGECRLGAREEEGRVEDDRVEEGGGGGKEGAEKEPGTGMEGEGDGELP